MVPKSSSLGEYYSLLLCFVEHTVETQSRFSVFEDFLMIVDKIKAFYY